MAWAEVLARLGLGNAWRVMRYRLALKLGVHRVRRLEAAVSTGPFFRPCKLAPRSVPAVTAWQSSASLFSYLPVAVTSSPPDWLANPLTGQRIGSPGRAWWEIPDFDPQVGDIKLIWELSRMDWALAHAQRARQGNEGALASLNAWLDDWSRQNPPYRGPNWKCGQEASIRVMHLAMASLILGQTRDALPGLLGLIRTHLQRISPTVQYAMAQDNNHGTSEAAALFIGGSWLVAAGIAEAAPWQEQGRQMLESCATRLIGAQGSFSQYSVNYHRVMLDTFSMVETWRRHLALPEFSNHWRQKACAASEWLRAMVDPGNGDAPCLGANDGARLLPLVDAGYRDHRPSVQLATALFAGERAYAGHGPWDHALAWLDVPPPTSAAAATDSRVFDDGGFALLRSDRTMVLMRYPRFRFRPSQADALHVDLWRDGRNLLRDAGTYSYNADTESLAYFPGTASHNTVQFDGRDQMPRLGRFLFGRWLETSGMQALETRDGQSGFAAGYRDHEGATHHRHLHLSKSSLRVRDRIAGFHGKAILRWRLEPGPWQLQGNQLSNGQHTLTVDVDMPVARMQLVQGWESRHYMERSALPVLEIEVHQAGSITSEYRWHE